MMMLLVALFLGNIPSFAFSASSQPNINCLIINLDYINCTWTEHEHNYTFRSRSKLQQRLWKDDTKEFCRGMRTTNGYKLSVQ